MSKYHSPLPPINLVYADRGLGVEYYEPLPDPVLTLQRVGARAEINELWPPVPALYSLLDNLLDTSCSLDLPWLTSQEPNQVFQLIRGSNLEWAKKSMPKSIWFHLGINPGANIQLFHGVHNPDSDQLMEAIIRGKRVAIQHQDKATSDRISRAMINHLEICMLSQAESLNSPQF